MEAVKSAVEANGRMMGPDELEAPSSAHQSIQDKQDQENTTSTTTDNNVNNNNDNDHTNTSTMDTPDKTQLDRRVSAPARFKPIEAECPTSGLCESHPQFKCKKYSRLRHSQGARLGAHKGSIQLNSGSGQTPVGRLAGIHLEHKSVSPLSGSSSASDSAFSRSRSTLGSADGDHRAANCFDCHSALKKDTNYGQSSSNLSSSSTCPNGASETDGAGDGHFQIIWRDLTYRVPRRRLSRLAAALRAHLCARQPAEMSEEPAGAHQQAGACKQRQVIFSNLNGCVRSGQLTAILGPSGAGKTTFLKSLTSGLQEGVSGSIDITGGLGAGQQLKLCIIPQKDYLFDNLTVMENLLFASRIKNTRSTIDHKQNVLHVAGLLGLQSCLNLKTSRLSGGQYKRVSIAQELLSQPDILILDEPTSGLDSLTCFKTVSVLRDLVNMSQAGLLAPLAIVMTIHQPQIKIFNLFHHVYILSSLGRCVYEGPPDYVIETVAERCNILPPADDQNPASFIIDLGSQVYGQPPIDSLVKLQLENFRLIHSAPAVEHRVASRQASDAAQIIEMDHQVDLHLQVGEKDDHHHHHHHSHDHDHLEAARKLSPINFLLVKENNNNHQLEQQPAEEPTKAAKFSISERLRRRNNHDHSFWLHTSLLMRRLWISMWRDSLLATTRISFHLIIPFIFYFVYSQKSGSANACPHVEREVDIREMVSDTNIQRLITQHDELILTFENVSLFFLLLYSFSMCVMAVTALSFPLNMQILLKETSNGWYTMPRFVMAKTLADLPMELTMPVISVSIAYAITGQPSSYLSWRMLTVTAVMTLCSLISQTQGLLFGAYFMNNVQAAVFVSQASTLPWILLSGFTTRVSELPKLLQWLSFGSIYRLGIESIVAVRYGFGMCPCDKELVNDTPPRMVGIPDQLKSVMRYYLDMYLPEAGDSTASPANSRTGATEQPISTLQPTAPAQQMGELANVTSERPDIFEKIATTMSRANTYGVDIASCADVRPFIMSAREVDESTLPTFMLILVAVLISLKILLFFVVRKRTG